jgi:hypothetical protein
MLRRGQFIQHHAQGENIAACIQDFAPRLLRRHVGDGAHGGARAGKHIPWPVQGSVRLGAIRPVGAAVPFFDLGQAEVQDLYMSGR